MDLKSMYDREYVADLARATAHVYPPFDRDAFIACVFDDRWPDRALKQRARHIAAALHRFLPADYGTALDLLRRVSPRMDAYGFQNLVFSDYVEVYGLDDWPASIAALAEFTRQMSAEFAIRPFIVRYPERTMARMLAWARSDSVHLRRLASEGCRPRLPWGIALNALKADPSPILPILEQLKLDESENVRRSVANNLNDISKDHPDLVLDLLRRWSDIDRDEIRALTRHALRTLLKQGHPGALALLGYPPPQIDVHTLRLAPRAVPWSGKVTVSLDIVSTSSAPQNLMIDFCVHLMRARGKHRPKVFKHSTRTIQPGERLHVDKTFSFAPVTTRRYYPGAHAVEPQINGQTFGRVEFDLLPDEQS